MKQRLITAVITGAIAAGVGFGIGFWTKSEFTIGIVLVTATIGFFFGLIFRLG